MNEDRPSYEPELLEDTVPAQTPQPRLGSGARLLAMFTTPAKVFEDIRIRPSWILVLVAMILLSIGAQIVVRHHLDLEGSIIENMERMGQDVSEAQLDRIVARAEKWSVAGFLVTIVVTPLLMILLAGIFLVSLRTTGGDTDFRTTFSTMLHAFWPPGLVSSIVTMAVISRMGMVSQQALRHAVKSNLAAFLPQTAPKWQAALAGSLDIFSIWVVVLLVLGFSITARISKGRAAVAVLVPWAVYVAGKVVLAMVVPGM